MATNMFLERTFDAPLSVGEVLTLARQSRWCYDLYNVAWRGSFLAAGGRKMICWFTAPDAESTRIALRQTGSDIRVLWPGTVHKAPEPVVANVLVERSFDAPVAFEDIQAIEDAGSWCLEAHHVRFARTFFSSDRKRMVCLYEAPDAEAVRVAQREAGMPVEAVWAFDRIGPHMLSSGAGQST